MTSQDQASSTPRRVLVTWGSKLGGTEGIARIIGEDLQRDGFEVELRPASAVRDPSTYDAVIVGGALYGNRWHADARRFVARNVAALRRIPVWMFSSGPLDASADERAIAPVTQVAVLMERVGARGHATFGGRLAPDAKGFPAAAMAKKLSGDWRNPARIRAWAAQVSRELPGARPGVAIDHPARAVHRLVAHGIVGWAVRAVLLAGLLQIMSRGAATAIHAVLAPAIFTAVAVHYFRGRGAREPLSTALGFAGIVVVLDAAVLAPLVLRSFALFGGIAGTWLPLGLVFLATWFTGFVMSTLPWPKAATTTGRGPDQRASVGA